MLKPSFSADLSGTLAAVAAWLPSPHVRSRIYAVTAAAMVAVGLLAIFSIGMLLLVGGALLAYAAVSAAAEARARPAAPRSSS